MNISIQNKLIVILGELARKAIKMEIYDRELNDIDDFAEMHNYHPRNISLINLLYENKNYSRFLLNIEFDGEEYLKIGMLIKEENGIIDESSKIRISIDEVFEHIVSKDAGKNLIQRIIKI